MHVPSVVVSYPDSLSRDDLVPRLHHYDQKEHDEWMQTNRARAEREERRE